VANAKPHDLYFFAEPSEMISGQMENPGVFLNASAVLERQFTAYCFDRWVESGLDDGVLPPTLGYVLNNLPSNDDKKFPFNLLRFITDNRDTLLDDFVAMFQGQIDKKSQDHIRTFAEGDNDQKGSLTFKILNGLFELAKERDSLQSKSKQLQIKIRKIEEDPAKDQDFQEQINELLQEKFALGSLVKHIKEKPTLNYFTDEGLLPNYAFPEAGVMLRSVILRKKKESDGNKGKYESFTYEYERPAASAISELAPANRFYAGRRRVQIDQIDMQVSDVEIWRFCNACSHMEMAAISEAIGSCPRCGSAMWADEGQKGQMVRMRTVFATTMDDKSRIADDSDDRDPRFYNKQMLVDIDEKDIEDAYFVDSEDYAFGFEFLRKATLREINFGEKDEFASKSTIAGQELSRKGFTICKHCGKVQGRDGKIKHSLFCSARNADSEKNLTQLVYLYREFSSEAVRILMPFLDIAGSDKNQHSFIAALQLGLKRRFGGNIDHLQVSLQEEPVPNISLPKKYLVLFDTVPGGTGYLKELMRSKEPLVDVIEKALEALKGCDCNDDPEKDGCYRCLFAYRHSYDMASTSRDTAIGLLQQILSFKGKLKKTSNLSHVKVNPLFDSLLELRFIEALKCIKREDGPASLSKAEVNGKPGYLFKIEDHEYEVELQRNLGPDDNVEVHSKADFIFWPKTEGVKPIVVFTDGYAFHFDRIGLDLAQRMAIAKSGNFNVWSITWKDVENQFTPQGHYYENFLKLGQHELFKLDSFKWLIRYLKNPDDAKWKKDAFLHGVAFLSPQNYSTPETVEAWLERIRDAFPEEIAAKAEALESPMLLGEYAVEGEDGQEPVVQIYCGISEEDARAKNLDGLMILSRLDVGLVETSKGFEIVWNGFLRFVILSSFLKHSFSPSSVD